VTYLIFQGAGTKIAKGELQLLGDTIMIDFEIDQGIGSGRQGRRHGDV